MDKYELVKENIGKGTFGSVSLVNHIPSKKQMVWKKINYGQLREKEIHQLINEVNILRELKHENIVRCYDKIVDKKHTNLYIVMEYCKGGDLAQLISKSKKKGQHIIEDFIWKILMQVTLALFECHRGYQQQQSNSSAESKEDQKKDKKNGRKLILHRDLKPSNIFLDEK